MSKLYHLKINAVSNSLNVSQDAFQIFYITIMVALCQQNTGTLIYQNIRTQKVGLQSVLFKDKDPLYLMVEESCIAPMTKSQTLPCSLCLFLSEALR